MWGEVSRYLGTVYIKAFFWGGNVYGLQRDFHVMSRNEHQRILSWRIKSPGKWHLMWVSSRFLWLQDEERWGEEWMQQTLQFSPIYLLSNINCSKNHHTFCCMCPKPVVCFSSIFYIMFVSVFILLVLLFLFFCLL